MSCKKIEDDDSFVARDSNGLRNCTAWEINCPMQDRATGFAYDRDAAGTSIVKSASVYTMASAAPRRYCASTTVQYSSCDHSYPTNEAGSIVRILRMGCAGVWWAISGGIVLLSRRPVVRKCRLMKSNLVVSVEQLFQKVDSRRRTR